eukprot:TRINITY_DN33662_c0_g1_i1.p1 TRINITY_DN33662_c0_g1~~TRINITY_DN33662_c0_g1_i1.p1  ORF type:complete len:1291 (-),score=275.35 TRINITY_DN33662_c0_g1_i1:143-3571(-)
MDAAVLSDSDCSDSEDEENLDEEQRRTKLHTGLFIRFGDDEFEEAWEKSSYILNVRRGSFMLFCGAFAIFMDRAHAVYETRTCHPASKYSAKGHDVAVMFALLAMMGAAFYNIKVPNVNVFWTLFLLVASTVVFINFPPFANTCIDLENINMTMTDWPAEYGYGHENFTCVDKAFRIQLLKRDCSLQGHTAFQCFQLFLLAVPYILPQFRLVHIGFLWLLVGYVGGTEVYYKFLAQGDTEDHAHSGNDVALHLFILLVNFGFTSSRKYYLEKGMRKQFVDDHKQRQATEQLYYIFEDMVPEHVIVRMLRDEVIADPVQQVSILFILIADFDQYSSRMSPKDLLKFLNKYFSQMDDICAANKVTKIETVAEEYVACVGCMPQDEGEPHQPLLVRLLNCAGQIMALQNGGQDNIKFKMGVHSGPIVAGVIGRKLPRFRLFGDTINTSARFMQKSTPGTCQFGVDTRKLIPDSVPVEEVGIVSMKGKGEVMAFRYDWEKAAQSKGNQPQSAAVAKRGSVVTTMDLLSPDQQQQFSNVQDNQKRAKMSEEEFDEIRKQVMAQKELMDYQMVWKGFENDEEEAWMTFFHRTSVCRVFLGRLHEQAILVAIMTLIEIVHMVSLQAGRQPDKSDGIMTTMTHAGIAFADCTQNGRFRIFLACRTVMIGLLVCWSFAARTTTFVKSARQVQRGVTITILIHLTMLWLSYDAVVLAKMVKTDYSKMTPYQYLNQQFSLIFSLMMYIVANYYPVMFFNTLAYLPVAIIFMGLRDRTSMYISNIGRVIFIMVIVLTIVLALENEKTSRARFLSKKNAREMEDRIKLILNTLMPPLLVEELRIKGLGNGAPPSHQYRHATITQSDLCGFTALAATRQPHEVVGFMGDLFGRFDRLTDVYEVYKVETVGDAYIAGMAERPLTYKNSPIAVVQFGMAMIEATDEWARMMGVKVKCRVGVHHGECVGGIVGVGMMRYHLFGQLTGQVDTLEATSREGVAQISQACYKALEDECAKTGRKLQDIFGMLEPRSDKLTTSKGEVHEYDEVGGHTFLIYPKDQQKMRGLGAEAMAPPSEPAAASAAPVAVPFPTDDAPAAAPVTAAATEQAAADSAPPAAGGPASASPATTAPAPVFQGADGAEGASAPTTSADPDAGESV